MPACEDDVFARLDQLDGAILDLLTADGRMSNCEIARSLDVADGTVRLRLKRMLDNKVARIGLVTDVAATGLGASAVLMIRTEPHMVRAVAERLAQLPSCGFVGLCFGRYDISAFVSAPTRPALARLMETELTPIAGIRTIDVREPVAWSRVRYDLVHVR